jgi:hypothetical protein
MGNRKKLTFVISRLSTAGPGRSDITIQMLWLCILVPFQLNQQLWRYPLNIIA